jgi:hypothetical protein
MEFSGILIDIRITFDKRNGDALWYLQVFSPRLELLSVKETEIRCGIFSTLEIPKLSNTYQLKKHNYSYD